MLFISTAACSDTLNSTPASPYRTSPASTATTIALLGLLASLGIEGVVRTGMPNNVAPATTVMFGKAATPLVRMPANAIAVRGDMIRKGATMSLPSATKPISSWRSASIAAAVEPLLTNSCAPLVIEAGAAPVAPRLGSRKLTSM